MQDMSIQRGIQKLIQRRDFRLIPLCMILDIDSIQKDSLREKGRNLSQPYD